jgi:hypothetical protein
MRVENSIGTPRPVKERITLLIRSLIMVFAVIVVMMQLDTNSVMRDVRSAFFCPDYYIDDLRYNPQVYDDLGINYIVYKFGTAKNNIYAHFNVTSHSEETKYLDQVNIDLKLHRLFAWHNFKKGKLWMKYSIEVTDERKNHIQGAWDIPVKLAIEKVNGVWSVTDIDEPP